MNILPNPFQDIADRPAPQLPAVPYLPPVILIPPVVTEVVAKHATKRVRKSHPKK